jgi:hypothetical protein
VLCHCVKGLLEDGAHVAEADIQEQLGSYPFYLELYLVQPGVYADPQVEEASKLWLTSQNSPSRTRVNKCHPLRAILDEEEVANSKE